MTQPLKKKHIEKTLTEAMALHQSGKLDEAAALYTAILGADAKEPNALLNLSTLLTQRGDFAQAEPLLKRLIVAHPKLPYGHFALGNMLLKQRRFTDAAACFARASVLDPVNATYHFNRGIALDGATSYDDAIASYARAVQLQPNHREALVNQANNLYRLGRHEETIALCDKIIANHPDIPLAYIARGNSYGALMRIDEALVDYEKAVALQPDMAIAHNNRGSMLEKQGVDALDSYEQAIAFDPSYADAHNNRATALNKLMRYEEGLASAETALSLQPTMALAHDARGNSLAGMRRFDEALAAYDRAIALRPDLNSAYWNKGLLLLLLGDLAEGLKYYEARWKTEFQRDHVRSFTQPLWLGEPLAGKTVFIYHEQGLGDYIQMFRYILLLAQQADTVYVETQHAMKPLVQPVLPPNVHFIPPHGTPDAPFDYQIPIMTLQLAFKTTLDTIPRTFPYLTADPAKRAKWQAKLGPKTHPRIGLVWSGATAHLNDGNRSMTLETLLPLLTQEGYEFHSLQKEIRDRDLPHLHLLADHRAAIDDFADTAALAMEMDLVISVDTSVAHLAGALGRPLWVMLPHAPDYRWLLERSDSPWYPTARLFRQPVRHDWPNAIKQAIEALHTQFPSTER